MVLKSHFNNDKTQFDQEYSILLEDIQIIKVSAHGIRTVPPPCLHNLLENLKRQRSSRRIIKIEKWGKQIKF